MLQLIFAYHFHSALVPCSQQRLLMNVQFALCCSLSGVKHHKPIKSNAFSGLWLLTSNTAFWLKCYFTFAKQHFETQQQQPFVSSSSRGPPELNLHFGLHCLKALIVLELKLIFSSENYYESKSGRKTKRSNKAAIERQS